MTLPVSLCSAAALAILSLWMMSRTGRIRQTAGIVHGDGGNALLARRIRAQLNFIETAPFILVLMVTIELSGKAYPWLPLVAAIYVIGRIAHVIGMDSETVSKPRVFGVAITMLVLLGLSIVAALIATGLF